MGKPWEATYSQPETKKPWEVSYEQEEPKPEEELPERTWKEAASDVGISAAKGIIGVPQALVGLADIAGTPFGVSPGKYLEEKGYDFEKNQKLLSEQYSPRQKAEIAALSKAEGVTDTILTAIAKPSAVGGMLMESVPSIAAGGIMGKVAKVAAGLETAVAAGAGEGLIGAGSAAADIRSETEGKELSGKGAISALGSGVGTALLGYGGSKLTTALGGIDVDTLLVGGAKKALAETVGEAEAVTPSMFRRVVTSTLGEGVLEEAPQSAQEKMWQNYATDKPLLEGVEDAAIKGGLLGSIMGGTVGAISGGTEKVPTTPPPPTTTGEVEKKEEPTPYTEQEQYVQKKDAFKYIVNEKGHSAYDKLMGFDYTTPEGIAEAEAYEKNNSEKLPRGFRDEAWDNYITEAKAKAGVEPKVPTPVTVPKAPKAKVEPVKTEEVPPSAEAERYKENDWFHPVHNPEGAILPPASEAEQNLSIDEQDEELGDISAPIEEQAQEFTPTHILHDVVSPRFPNKPLKDSIPIQLVPVKDPSDPFEATFYKDQQGNLYNSDMSNDIKPIAAEAEAVKVPEQKQAAPVPLHTPETLIEGFKTSRPTNFSTNTQVKKALTEQGVPEEQNTLELQQQIRAAHNAHVQGIKEKPAAVVGEQEQEKEEPYVDAVKVEMYDKALDKVEEVVLGDKKSSAKPLILKLIDQGLLTREHLVNYENIFKDKDMGLDDIMSEVRTDLEVGRETALTSATARPTKLLNLEQGKVEAPIDEEVADEDLTQYERDQLQAQGFANKITDRKAETARLEQEEADRLALERQEVRDRVAAKKLANKPAPRGKKTITPEEAEYGNEIAEQGEQDYFSVAPTDATTGHTAASLERKLSPEMKRLVASGKAVIHDTVEDLNKAVPGTHPANVQGLTTKEGVTHYVANKLTPETLHKIALHETGVHAGMRKMLGDKLWAYVKDQAMTNQGAAFVKARASVPEGTPDHLIAEETLAYLVENSPNLSLVRQIVAAIRNFLRAKLGANIKLSEADARQMATQSLRKESKTTERTARKETAFSKEKLLAPNGKPSNLNAMQHAQVRTPEFKKWFGDWENDPENASKVVDENGEPLVVYHKTRAFKDFTEFDPTKSIDGWDIHFGTKESANDLTVLGDGSKTRIIPAFLNIKHMPHTNHDDGHWGQHQLIHAWEEYWRGLPIEDKRQVRDMQVSDGIKNNYGSGFGKYIKNKAIGMAKSGTKFMADEMFKYGMTGLSYRNAFEDKDSTSYIVMAPNQIKSAIGNTGAFSAENPDIRYSLTPTEQVSQTAREARTKDNIPVKPPSTPFYKNIAETISNAETKYLSYDAKFINTLRGAIKALGLPVQAMQKLMLQASQSQTVQATATAGAAAVQGDIKYNPNSLNWEAVDGKHSMPEVRRLVEEIAKAKGESFATINKIFSDIMVASRIAEIYKKADAVKAQAKSIKDKAKKAEFLRKNRHHVSLAVVEQTHMSRVEVAKHLQTLAANTEYQAPLDEWQGVRKSVVDFLVKSGRYSPEQAANYMDAVAYVPFQRIMHDRDVDSDTAYVRASEKKVGKAGLSAGQRERAMKGSAREVDDIISNMEKWVVNSYIKGIKAAKSKELIDLADSYLPPDAVTELSDKASKEGAVTCYRHGVKEYWHFDDPFMTFAFNGINNPLTMPTLKTGAKVANKLREYIVLNPLFTISQLPQDTFAAMFSSGVKHPFALPFEVIKEFGATLFNTKQSKTSAHEKLKAIGATGQKDFIDSFASSIHDIAYGGDVAKKSKLRQHLEHIAMAGDNAVRQAVYNRTLKEMKGNPNAEAIAQERAFEVINFRRKGASASLDAIRQITPFFGAYLQAQRVALNVLSGRGISPTERKEAMQTLAMTTAQVVAYTMLYNMVLGATGIGGDDEEEADFTKRNIKDRDKKMFIPGTKATLPLRQDVFSIPFILSNHAYQYMFEKGTKNPAEAWKAVGEAVLHTLPGIGMPMGPTIAKPFLEVAINHDFFTGRDITPQRLQGKDTSLQYNERTSEVAKMLGKTGFINPMNVDHLVKGLTGYVGGGVLLATDMAIRLGLDTPYMDKGILGKGARDFPGVTSLYAKDYDPQDVDTYYKMRTEVDKANDTYNTIKKLGKREEAREYKQDHRTKLKGGVKTQLNKMVSKIDTINEKIRKLAEIPNERMSPEAKRARRDQLDAKIRHIQSGVERLQKKVYPE